MSRAIGARVPAAKPVARPCFLDTSPKTVGNLIDQAIGRVRGGSDLTNFVVLRHRKIGGRQIGLARVSFRRPWRQPDAFDA